MERSEEFIEKFRQNPSDAEHLISVKEIFQKVKRTIIGGGISIYLVIYASTVAGVAKDNQYLLVSIVAVAAVLGVLGVVLVILFLDARGYELTDEELATHELAEAVRSYESNPPNYEDWKYHLSNVKKLLVFHEANSFSRYRKNKVLTYIMMVEGSDAETISKFDFDGFYHSILLDLLEERTNEFNESIDKMQAMNASERRIYGILTIIQSSRNLMQRWRIRTLAPIVIVLAFGLSIYFLHDTNLGSFITIAGLTTISIKRGRRE